MFGNATPGAGMQARPENAQDICRDLLPNFHRTVRTEGAKIDKWWYFAPVPRHYPDARHRRDPLAAHRDLSEAARGDERAQAPVQHAAHPRGGGVDTKEAVNGLQMTNSETDLAQKKWQAWGVEL